MDVESRMELFMRPPTAEVLTVDRLREYLLTGVELKHYIGYEVSGYMHLGTGVVPIHKVVDLQAAGVDTMIFLADYHSWVNRKLGGDLDTIRRVAGGYYLETFKKVIEALGGDPSRTRFVLASDFYEEMGSEYFRNFLRVSLNVSLSRVRRSISIMGRREGESVSFGQLVYVPMQVADIFSLGVNVAHGGIDQRKAHVVAIELGDEFGYKPIAIHHRLVLGIGLTEEEVTNIRMALESGDRDRFVDTVLSIKMSKSLPDTAIFLHDDREDIERKLRRAYCPPREVKVNPVFSMLENVVYPYLVRKGLEFVVVNEKTGEEYRFERYEEVVESYLQGGIHPLDLKMAVARYIGDMLEPVRDFLLRGGGRRFIEELDSLRITR